MSAVAILVARGGSVRIPRKNVKLFAGMPMISYPLKAAQESGLFDAIYVSTEDEEIAAISRSFGAMILMRSEKYAQDEIGTQEVMRDALLTLADAKQEFDYACCIYPVCPMLTAEDLHSAWWHLLDDGVPYVFVPGYYYFGHVTNFRGEIPLAEGLQLHFPPERYIDVNTSDDWSKMEELYAAIRR